MVDGHAQLHGIPHEKDFVPLTLTSISPCRLRTGVSAWAKSWLPSHIAPSPSQKIYRCRTQPSPTYRSIVNKAATLRAAAPLYNPHSRNVRAAPRFSPTRFIPLVAPAGIILELAYSHALGIKRYTLGGYSQNSFMDDSYFLFRPIPYYHRLGSEVLTTCVLVVDAHWVGLRG